MRMKFLDKKKIMNIKEQLADICNEMDKKSSEINKARLASKILALQADLQDDKIEVPADVFESLTADTRKVALQGFILIVVSTLQE